MCCRYTGHCPLLRFSMGQTYGQMTGQLLRGSPGLAWPPAHRTLLPPIQPPRSPEPCRRSLPVRRGHKRLSSSMVPGYTGSDTGMNRGPHPRTRAPRSNASSLPPAHLGFVPQAQFIFAKNCSQVWAEALNGNPDKLDRYVGKEIRDIMAKLPEWRQQGSKRLTIQPYGRQRYFERRL